VTDTQTLEGAVALLRESLTHSTSRDWLERTDAFLALPSVSPDLPADTPGEGQALLLHPLSLVRQIALEPQATTRIESMATQAASVIDAYLNALASAPAPSSDALRDESVALLSVLDAEGFDGDRSAVNYHRSRLRAALAAEEARDA